MTFRFFRTTAERRAHLAARAPGRVRLSRALQTAPLPDRLGILLATLGGLGFLPRSGTLGAVAGALAAGSLASRPGLSWMALAALIAASLPAIRIALRAAAVEDPGECVIDEVAGAWLACLASGLSGPWLALPLVLFVLADAVKPWPASALDRRPGAPSVMGDDLAAGAWAALLARALGCLLPG